jgi:hypothetical protein
VSDLLKRAELIKLARVLGATEEAVSFLRPLPVDELRRLEDRVSLTLFNDHRPALQKLADASRLLPASLVAKMSELVFGPMLSARVAGLMPPDRAVDVAAKLRTTFLADVCVQLDPRSAAELLALIPTKIIVDVAALLLQRREYVTMGRFVDDLPDDAIRAVTDSIDDDAALVRIASFVERRERLNELIELLGPERLQRLVGAVAAGPPEVQAAGLAMMSQFTRLQQGRFGEAAIALGPKALNALTEAAQREDALDVIGAVMQNVGATGRAAFAAMLESMDDATLAAWAHATGQAGLWPVALRILASSNAALQQQAARALGRLGKAPRAAIAAAIKKERLQDALEPLKPLL